MGEVPLYPLFVSAAGCGVCSAKPPVVKVLPKSAASRLAWYWPVPGAVARWLHAG